MHYDAVVIGGGLSGLTAAALLAKRNLHVAVVDRNAHPGGSCGAFRRGEALIDQGAAMLFGFGQTGFNPHRFVFNVLEEPIDVIRHESMYTMEFAGERIEFTPDLDRFTEDLARVFPSERDTIKRFYADMGRLYHDVIAGTPSFTTPDEMDGKHMLPQIKAHPRSYLKFLRLMNKSVEDLIGHYFTDPRIHQFYDKLCSTYCYTTASETPAVLGAVMFVDNHVGGTYYPAGSTLMLTGALEKVIEEHGGDMLMHCEAVEILFEDEKPCGVAIRKTGDAPEQQIRKRMGDDSPDRICADSVIYSGNVWDLYDKLLPSDRTTRKERAWAKRFVPTAASAVLYLVVKASAIPVDTPPVQMFAEHPEQLNDDEITAYIMSIDDPTLCPPDQHVLTVVGPCFDMVEGLDEQEYANLKRKIARRFLGILESRFPGICDATLHVEVATPRTLQQRAGKYRGAVAGPKQMMGQHMLKRQHTRTRFKGLVCCGESTVMGTGTPTVTISGIAAANALLRDRGLAPYVWEPNLPNYVRDVPRGWSKRANESELTQAARHCLLCEHPACNRTCPIFDVPGIMRRIYTGNLVGARKLAEQGIKTLESGDYVISPTVAVQLAADRIVAQTNPASTSANTNEPVSARMANGRLPSSTLAEVAAFERDCIQARSDQHGTPIAFVVSELLA